MVIVCSSERVVLGNRRITRGTPSQTRAAQAPGALGSGHSEA